MSNNLDVFEYLNELNVIKELLGEISKEYNNLYHTISSNEVSVGDLFSSFYDIIYELKVVLDNQYEIEVTLNEDLRASNSLIYDLKSEIDEVKFDKYREGYLDGYSDGEKGYDSEYC